MTNAKINTALIEMATNLYDIGFAKELESCQESDPIKKQEIKRNALLYAGRVKGVLEALDLIEEYEKKEGKNEQRNSEKEK